MSDDINWPEKGNKAFVPVRHGAYFHMPSVLAFNPVHVRAFKAAAEIILDKCEADGDMPSNDKFVFPVLYLYRHGIELNLKAIIRVGIGLEFFKKEDVAKDLERHNLANLWNHAKKLLLDHWSEDDPGPVHATDSIINELHESDPDGQKFRYESAKGGKLNKYEKLPDRISVINLKKTMDGVFHFLGATCAGLEEHLQTVYKMRAEMEEEFRGQDRPEG
ncbi:MAG: hypothetical protein JWP89_2611 [Schlesneria sp.]|nr:hypothetical protein [Schlesneria sp.]